MEIVKVNSTETTVSYSITGNIIDFRDGELTLDLSKYERDFDVVIDITENNYKMLQTGISKTYVAQISIPARTYTVSIVDEETIKTANEFSIDNCELKLWEVK